MNRIYEFNQTRKHRKEVQRIAKSLGYSFPMHDFFKMLSILIFGDRIATKLHRKFSNHHAHDYKRAVIEKEFRNGSGWVVTKQETYRDIPNKIEAAIDWEAAQFIKTGRPLNAYETWKKYYSDIDMEDTLKMLGFWPTN